MERIREAPPPTDEDTSSVESLPALAREAVPLRERLELLRMPGVTREEIDGFLAGLQAPFPAGEDPRERADLLLEVLGDERLCEFTGGDGRRVGTVALERLLELGYPYALEVTPEMLARARGPQPIRIPRLMLLGLGLAVLNVLAHPVLRTVDFFELLPEGREWTVDTLLDHALRHLGLVAPVLLGPPLISALAEWYDLRSLKRFFNAAQWLVGGMSLLMAWTLAHDWGKSLPLVVTGVLAIGTVLCLTPRKDPDP